MNRSKAKGTRWETALVEWLKAHGFPKAERRALTGTQDRGDVAGIDGLVIQAKDAATLRLYEWCDDVEEQRERDGARWGFVAVKRYGSSDPGRGYAVLTIDRMMALVCEVERLRVKAGEA